MSIAILKKLGSVKVPAGKIFFLSRFIYLFLVLWEWTLKAFPWQSSSFIHWKCSLDPRVNQKKAIQFGSIPKAFSFELFLQITPHALNPWPRHIFYLEHLNSCIIFKVGICKDNVKILLEQTLGSSRGREAKHKARGCTVNPIGS